MGRSATLAGTAAGALAGLVGARVLLGARRRRDAGGPGPGGWQVVTVDRAPGEVLPGGRWPEPLRRLGGAIQVEVWPAPGCRGTELAARLRPGTPLPGLAAHLVGDDPARVVRVALRQAKQLAETGEVLRADRTALDRGPAG
ncbi:hypothetical protein [Micromonospora sp. NPDC126480]|uniref:hypothetical protein n=1 Tax=Micromonospora sp. NPDC126480 TaxID=3155312 RepID=UPI00332C110B